MHNRLRTRVALSLLAFPGVRPEARHDVKRDAVSRLILFCAPLKPRPSTNSSPSTSTTILILLSVGRLKGVSSRIQTVMRKQRGAQSLRSIGSLRRTSYICSDCRRNASRSASTRAAKSGQGLPGSLQRPDFVSIAPIGISTFRWLHNSSQRPGPVDAPSSTIGSHDAMLASRYIGETTKHKESKLAEGAVPPGRSSNYPIRDDIRSRLRKWSEEQSRLAIAGGNVAPIFGALPPNNSLMLEDPEPQDEDEVFERHEDNIDEEDDNLYARNPLGLEPGDVFRASLYV